MLQLKIPCSYHCFQKSHKSETDPLSGLPSTEIAPTVTDTHEPANDVDNPSEPSTKCRPPDSQDTYCKCFPMVFL